MNNRLKFAAAAIVIFFTLLISNDCFHANADAQTAVASDDPTPSWIIKWKQEIDPAFVRESVILEQYPGQRVVVARPVSPDVTDQWVADWSQSDSVEYFQPNEHVAIAATPDDPLLVKQAYLQQIHAAEAWNYADSNTSIVIAVVDTGVDLEHPDLKDNLVQGVNLLKPNLPPQDDNGHGTNVAGIIAAVGNNDKGVAGLLWKAKIMPIKALEADGTGGEAKLGEGIRYAVDHGAKIVVLSLGLNKYTPYMSEIVQYAEDHGVLLVAASGNEGDAVKYPAAYPTVLAVGGVLPDKRVDERSNFGPELDLVAPMNVFTTALGSGYEYKDGTSMAAPQVAAISALVWSRHPELKPYQIRNLLRQTAEDLETPYWDPHTGYGLLRADRAISEDYKADMYEPNDVREQAKPLTLGKMMTAQIAGSGDRDWFFIDAPYDGTVNIKLEKIAGNGQLQITYYDEKHPQGTVYAPLLEQGVDLPVKAGKSNVEIRGIGLSAGESITYRMLPQFRIYRDSFEDNDRQYKAYTLTVRNQTVKGTFDHVNDEDWYLLPVKTSGLLKISVSVDTARMDPVLLIQKKGEKAVTIDQNGDAEPETSSVIDVLPGEYYIRVSNVKEYAYPVVGEYSLTIDFTEKNVDPNEPNDKPYQATAISLDSEYNGVLETADDPDWFEFKLDQEVMVHVGIDDIPRDQAVSLKLFDGELNEIDNAANAGGSGIRLDKLLPAGAYYLKLTTDGSFQQTSYRLQVHAAPLVAGFADIADHWAVAEISELAQRGIVEGYGNYDFRPDDRIARAEAAVLVAKAFSLPAAKDIRFADVDSASWAYDAIARAAARGIVDGYPDGTFGPSRSLSRKEMAVLFARALGLRGVAEGEAPFADVSADDWAAPFLRQMKAEGLIQGYADGSFLPDRAATRAEFVFLLSQAMKR